MMLASINLNKRFGADGARARFAAWLRRHDVAVIVVQEPYKPADRRPPLLPGYVFAGGDGHLATWVREDIATPTVSAPTSWAQRVELGWLTILQVHLDAYTSAARTTQLGELGALAAAEGGRPLLVCGDFNLAPRPQDGLYGGEISGFTADTERKALQHLLQAAWLVDTTGTDEEADFTFERLFTGKLSRFRCDLALLSDHLAAGVPVAVRHEVRTGPEAFTDHSAILLDLPITPEVAEPDDVLFAISDLTGKQPAAAGARSYQPHKTAMSRQAASPAARAVTGHLTGPLGIRTVLDHGCGRGADVAHYRAAGLDADGYDPHEGFGWPRPEREGYDLVTQMFVLNVLPDPGARIRALQDAAEFVRPGGRVVIVTRSPEEITKAAAGGSWTAHHDGYWSSEGKGTFQRGISAAETTALARHAGLAPAVGEAGLPLPGVSHIVLVKPEP
ncbi:methyltransferase domain-containing protein [Streptomyces sp. NBC_00513]|uniref:endonuclease/exonuclease/phosphatase family protein n=1 Tax=unclassified Streptomyces TaxID=2593676 RepID=UPI0022522C76|nr:endonuclease/exonuclease/phosphatase family protein [Streptomyces sp. NBC_00424]MCX5078666.1 methyltransferase domain-containing protein [Streptomyces sp. NBC_00424]WUD39109.1 methyltransferase domain-containing protein [Streptomyces sp. NBC_00513]WUD45620.1 methyltransferase domain-containing protein [Streptomyces sp. NBC_00513]